MTKKERKKMDEARGTLNAIKDLILKLEGELPISPSNAPGEEKPISVPPTPETPPTPQNKPTEPIWGDVRRLVREAKDELVVLKGKGAKTDSVGGRLLEIEMELSQPEVALGLIPMRVGQAIGACQSIGEDQGFNVDKLFQVLHQISQLVGSVGDGVIIGGTDVAGDMIT